MSIKIEIPQDDSNVKAEHWTESGNRTPIRKSSVKPFDSPDIKNFDGSINQIILDSALDVAYPGDSAKKKRKKKRNFKKAPDAPVRAKTGYVLYCLSKRDEIKANLPKDCKVTEIMRCTAAAWREMTHEEKSVWLEKGEKEKVRYTEELKAYDGPLKVPNKRAKKTKSSESEGKIRKSRMKKNPRAPKRPMSAFLFFGKVMRPRLMEQYPDAKVQDLSRIMGEEWKRMGKSDKEIYEMRAAEDIAIYNEAMHNFKESLSIQDSAGDTNESLKHEAALNLHSKMKDGLLCNYEEHEDIDNDQDDDEEDGEEDDIHEDEANDTEDESLSDPEIPDETAAISEFELEEDELESDDEDIEI